MIFNYKRLAKSNSYKCVEGKPYKRKLKDIKAIVIHYSGLSNDTARNECDYFATGNTRLAGAHSFVDEKGLAGRSIYAKYVAWSVGDKANGKGAYFNMYNNYNTISIELCGIADRSQITEKQKKKLKQLIRYYGKKCPNIENIVRHFDITTKKCPAPYCASIKNDAKWQELRSELMLELKKVR